MKTIYPADFNKADVRKEIDRSHDQYVLVSADKAGNNLVVCKTHFLNCIFKQQGFNSTHDNPTCTYTNNSLFKQNILQKSYICFENL